jgi:broad specificity phosphatase PhoE
MTTLILVRHGETKKNKAGELHGAFDSELLTAKGRRQLIKTSEALKNMNISLVYTSEENRAQESAKIVSENLGVPLKKIAGLQERNWGDFSGKSWDEVKEVLDPMTLQERFTYKPPEGESWKEAEERLINVVKKVLRMNEGKTVAIITHGGAIRILMPYLLGAPIEETFKHDPDNGSLTIFEYSDGKFKAKRINDTSHLK